MDVFATTALGTDDPVATDPPPRTPNPDWPDTANDNPRKQSLMRAVNADVRKRLDPATTSRVPFFCECATHGCYMPLWLTPAEYDVLGSGHTYALAPGHVERDTTTETAVVSATSSLLATA